MVGEEDPQPEDEGDTGEEKMILELTCPHCNFSKKVPADKIPKGVRWATCPRCRRKFEIGPHHEVPEGRAPEPETREGVSPGSAAVGPEPARCGAPWENRSVIGLWRSIFQTLTKVLFSPGALFSRLNYDAGIREPLAYGLLTGSLGAMFGFFWQFIMFSGESLGLGESLFGRSMFVLVFGIILVSIPLFVVLGLFVYSAVLHLMLLAVRGAGNGFEATFRVVSYSQAAQVLGLIPFVGGPVGGIWQFVVTVIGLREIHETSYLRVFSAFLILTGLGCLVLAGTVFVVFSIIPAA